MSAETLSLGTNGLALFAGLQVGDLYLVEEPALELAVSLRLPDLEVVSR